VSEFPAIRRPEAVPAKRRQILAGAREVFGQLGFERASVDLIASRAGVSKATVYNHFEDKSALFVACVLEGCDDLRAGLQACLRGPSGPVEEVLQVIGEKVMAVTLAPAVSDLYRHTIAVAARFPETGRMLFERGWLELYDAIAAYLERWDERGALRVEDARSAAIQFVALCQSDLAVRSRLGILTYPVDEQVRDTVKRAVATFVRAYRP
jgi:TetR/AcrR family transcriptional regulator, mexJK operon transcriptional repressor